MLKPAQELQELDETSYDIFLLNITDYYARRPNLPQWNKMPMCEFASEYVVTTQKPIEGSSKQTAF